MPLLLYGCEPWIAADLKPMNDQALQLVFKEVA